MIDVYKESPLGIIPITWETKTLGELLEVNTGAKNAQDSILDGEYPFFTRSITTQRINSFSYDTEALFIAGEGIFKVKHYNGKFDVHQRTYVLTAKDKLNCSLKFFQNQIQSRIIKLVDTSVGSTVQSLRKPIIQELKLVIPPLPEQQKIAEILSTVDDKIEVIDQQIVETQALKKGLIQRLLTKGIGHTEFKDSVLGEIPKSWEVVNLGNVCKLKGGFAFKSTDSCEQGIRWVKIANVGVNRIKWDDESFLPKGFETKHKEFVLNEGDIVIAMTRPILSGKLKIAMITKTDSGSLLNQRVGRIVQDDTVNKDFVYQFFNSASFIEAMEKELMGTDPPNISSSMFEALYIVLPCLSEQQKIAEILISVDNKLEVLSEKKNHYQELKRGLMQQLLTGKIRVNV